MRTVLGVVCGCLVALRVAAGGVTDEDVSRLLDGVQEIAAPGAPGTVVATSGDARVLVTGRVAGDLRAPVAAAATLGRGRVVIMGHTGYLDAGACDVGQTGRFVANVLWWCGRGRDGHPVRVGVLDGSLDRIEGLAADRLEFVRLPRDAWTVELPKLDVLVAAPDRWSDAEAQSVKRFVLNRGGLLVAQTGWGWLQLNPGKTLPEHPGNILLSGAGLLWSDAFADRTTPDGFATEGQIPEVVHAGAAVDAILAYDAGEVRMTELALRQASWSATDGVRHLPPGDIVLRPRVMRLLRERADRLVPTRESPITTSHALERFLLALQVEGLASAGIDEIDAHPAALHFPGEVSREARRVSRRFEIDPRRTGWHSTGLYAPPGSVITLRCDGEAARAAGLRVRIGCHPDHLWNKDRWDRVPEITISRPITGEIMRLASPYGGLVYIESARPGAEASVEIAGVVEAPLFVLDETSDEAWRAIRGRPAPWAELACSRIVLTVPSSDIRTLDNPTELMRLWERILDADAELAQRPAERERPERIVADVQISAGYMHSGYPIMTHLDAAPVMVDTTCLRENLHGGVWGLLHELGHNHQSADWTFGGTGEVTCNLFTLYAMDKALGIDPAMTGRAGGDQVEALVMPHLRDGADFERWKSHPFLALQMYVQLQEAFGWEAYRRVFAEYRDLPAADRPTSDAEKRDQWMVRFSRAVGHDLGPFFERWGVPTSVAARESINELPDWMPEALRN